MQINKFNRSNFYKVVSNENGREYDLTSNTIVDFNFSREMTFYTVAYEDIGRPDLIAVKAYGDKNKVNVWWIIMYVNQVFDCQHDLYAGKILKIPHTLDLNDLVTYNFSQR